MNAATFGESGNATSMRQEKFSVRFELPNFDIQESYEEIENTGNFRRKVRFEEYTSPPQYIGQTIDFPSGWCVTVRCGDNHARLALQFASFMKDGIYSTRPITIAGVVFALLKFRLKLVDKDGDVVYEKPWHAWTHPRKIILGQDYAMMDFISVEELFDSQQFLAANRTLRVLCEGVLYSDFRHATTSIARKSVVFPLISRCNTKEHHDVDLISAAETPFKAHRLILSYASPVFESWLNAASLEATKPRVPVYLDDLSDPEVEKILQYVYKGNILEQDWGNVKEVDRLIQLAKTFELRGLRGLCYHNLVQHLTLADFLEVAKMFQRDSVEESLRGLLSNFYMKNQEKLVQRESFKNFAKEDKKAFLYVVLFGSRSSYAYP